MLLFLSLFSPLLLLTLHVAVGFFCVCWRDKNLEREKQAFSKQRRYLVLEKKKIVKGKKYKEAF